MYYWRKQDNPLRRGQICEIRQRLNSAEDEMRNGGIPVGTLTLAQKTLDLLLHDLTIELGKHQQRLENYAKAHRKRKK